MKCVYKCEYCDEINENKEVIIKHELDCGHNPKNWIADKDIIKLSIINSKFEDAFVYVLLSDYYDKLDYFLKEFFRATDTNCRASVYEMKNYIPKLINRVKRIDKKEIDWYKSITERDSQEFINAIRTCIKLPEARVNNLESKDE